MAGATSISDFRRMFAIAGHRSYLYSGALAPAAAPVLAALEAWRRDWELDPITRYDGFTHELGALRAGFARLIGADEGEVAIADNTSRATNLAVACLSARPGSNVVIDDTTYPSSAYAWLNGTGHELRRVAASQSADPEDAIAAAIDGETVAVCVSHVSPETGFRHDLTALAAVAHDHGALLMVDAAQTAGVLPIDVRASGVDVLVTTAMKWLLGPPGIAFAFVSLPLLRGAPVPQIGYAGVDLPFGEGWPMTTLPPLLDDARRLELGVPALPGLGAASAGIELLRSVGIERVHARVEGLATTCIDGLRERGVTVRTPADPARRCGVIAIEHPSSVELAAHLRARAVDIGGYPWGVARIDPHAFNDEADIEALLHGLDAFDGA